MSKDKGGIGWGATFTPRNISKDHLHMKQLPKSNFWTLEEDHRLPERQINLLRIKYGEGYRWKRRQIISGWVSVLGRESWRRWCFHKIGNPLTGCLSEELRNIRGNHNEAKLRKFTTEIALNNNYQQKSNSHTCFCQQQVEAGCIGTIYVGWSSGKGLGLNAMETFWGANVT